MDAPDMKQAVTGYGILDARGVLLASREHPEQALWAARELFADRVAWVVRLSDDAVLAFHQRAPGKRPATVRHQVAEVQSEQLAALERPLLPRPAPMVDRKPDVSPEPQAEAAPAYVELTVPLVEPPAPVIELVEPSPEERLLAALGPELLTTDQLAARTGLDRDRARTGLLALWSDGLARWERACWARREGS